MSKQASLLLLAALTVFSVAANAEESDQAYAKRMQTEAVPGCANAAAAQLNLSPTAATSVCSCAFRRMFAENPVKELRAMAKANDRQASARIMRPLMLACYEAETAKKK